MQTRAPHALGTWPGAIWESEAAQCILCGERRRDYLFVVGSARVTRCYGCGLISRTGSEGGVGASYRLDADCAASLTQALPAGRILLVSDEPRALVLGPGQEAVAVAPAKVSQALDAAGATPFAAALINGSLDFVADPLALLRGIAGAVRPGGPVIVVAGATDISRLPADALPAHSFSPATLLRLAQVAGLRTESCGLLRRSIDTPAPDPRLAQVPPVPLLARVIARILRRPIEVSSGVFELRARVAEVRQRPKLSIIMPVYNEAATFLDTFHRVHGAKLESIDRELIVVESNSTDGSRELVRSVAHLSGVRAVYQDAPLGKGHAVRAGMAVADGDVLLIQDADSEYDVGDYDIVLEPLLRLSSTFVLGSRHLGGRTWKIRQFADARTVAAIMNLGHQLFTSLANWLYGAEMHDPTTMYKVFRREAVAGLRFRRNRFDFDWELVCKLIRRGHLPAEVPINYRSRSYAEGKKVRFFRDPITWLRTIIASRFEPLA
jgi:glycosyl transferase family 2